MFRRLTDDDYMYRMLSVDNGSSNLGLTVVDMDLRTGHFHVLYANTLLAAKMLKDHKAWVATHGERWVRESLLQQGFREVLWEWRPDAVPVENNFFQPGRVTSFETLAEMKVLLRQEVEQYDDGMDLILISPGEAKRAVQPAEFTMKKAVIRDCILALDNLTCVNTINLETLTEHEYDTLAVAVCHGNRIRRFSGFVR